MHVSEILIFQKQFTALPLYLTLVSETAMPYKSSKRTIHSQALPIYSGVARPSPLLGHSMGTLRLYELPREVQKLIVGLGHPPPPNFTASQVGSEAIYRSEV